MARSQSCVGVTPPSRGRARGQTRLNVRPGPQPTPAARSATGAFLDTDASDPIANCSTGSDPRANPSRQHKSAPLRRRASAVAHPAPASAPAGAPNASVEPVVKMPLPGESSWEVVFGALGFSPREQAVVRCLTAGASEKDAANQIHCSIHTVHEHVKRVYRKLRVHSRGELLARILDMLSEHRGSGAGERSGVTRSGVTSLGDLSSAGRLPQDRV